MPSREKRWDTIDRQIEYHLGRKTDAFKFFVKIATAVVGGAAYVSIQPGLANNAKRLEVVSDVLMVFAALLSAFMIYEHHRAWHGWRKAQHELSDAKINGAPGEREVPAPNKRSSLADKTIAASCIGFAIAFCFLNPLR